MKKYILLSLISINFQCIYTSDDYRPAGPHNASQSEEYREMSIEEIERKFIRKGSACFVCDHFVNRDRWVKHLRNVHVPRKHICKR